MKKYIAITVLIILAIFIYRERYMISLGFDYLFSKSQTTAIVDPVKEKPLINPLESFGETKEQEIEQETPESEVISSQTPAVNSDVTEQEVAINKETSVPTAAEAVQKQSFDAIAAYYNKELISLEKEFRSSLDSLIASAISDYNSGNYKKLELANQYLKKGEELEKSSDSKFYGLLKTFETELLNNGYNTDLIKDVDKYYTAMKKAEKTRIVDTGMGIVNN
jgi:hypothetical protein